MKESSYVLLKSLAECIHMISQGPDNKDSTYLYKQ